MRSPTNPRYTRDPADPDFPHGEDRGWGRGCRCDACQRGRRAAQSRRDFIRNTGRALSTDARRVQEHMLALIAGGLSVMPTREELVGAGQVGLADSFLLPSQAAVVSAVVAKTGMSRRGVLDILQGKRDRMRVEAAVHAMSVTVQDAAAAASLVPNKRPLQRARSLMALGYTGQWITAELGYASRPGLPPWAYQHQTGWMRRDVADRIEALADRIGDTPGPSQKARAWARSRGWFVPGAYDDNGDLIPGAARPPDRHDRPGTRDREAAALRIRKVARLTEEGLSAQEIAVQLRVTERQVVRDRRRAAGQDAAA